MSWLEYLARREAEDAATKRQAASAVSGDWLGSAWERASDTKFVESLYDELDVPEVAEVRERLMGAHNQPESLRVLLEEGAHDVGPLAIALLSTDHGRWILRVLAAGVDLGRPLHPHLSDVDATARMHVLAASPHEGDRALVIDALSDMNAEDRGYLVARLLMSGDTRVSRAVMETLDLLVSDHDTRAERVFGGAEAQLGGFSPDGLLMAIAEQRPEGVAPKLVRLLRTDHAVMVLYALSQYEDASVVDAIQSYYDSIVGDPKECCVLRLGAGNALSRLGRPQPVDDARHARDVIHRERYGYPDWDDLAMLHRFAAEALLDRGDETDQQWVASLATAPQQILRVVGRAAVRQDWVYWDGPRARRVLEQRGAEALFAALDDPTTVFRYTIVEVLADAADDDESVRHKLAAWCRADIEGTRNFYTQYVEDVPPLYEQSMRFLRRGLDETQQKVALEGTTSLWLKTYLLDGAKMQRPSTPIPTPEGVSVEPFDSTPWSVGKKVNGLAVSPDGKRLAILGEGVSRQLDATTGLTALHQELRWSWGYDCEFSPDGQYLAACFHGGHVEIYEAATGKRLHELNGHGGVPTGVKCLAWSADGSMLVTGGSDDKLVAWDTGSGEMRWKHSGGEGTYQDVAFLPDGRVLATHVKTAGGEKDFLEVLEADGGRAITFDRKKSMWAIAVRDDGVVAIGGDDKGIFLCKDPVEKNFKTWRKLKQAKVTQLRFVGNTLYAASESGMLMSWDTESREGTVLIEEGPPLWALAVADERVFAAGKTGVVHVFEDGKPIEVPGESHGRRVVAIDQLESGVVSADWDGKVIRWPHEGGFGELVVDLELTIESSAKVDEDTVLYGTRKGMRLVKISTGELLASTDVRADEVAIDGSTVGHYARSEVAFASLPELEAEGDSLSVGTDTMNAIAAAPGGGFVTGNEDGQVCFVKSGERVWVKAEHGADRLRTGDPHCNVASIAFTPDGTHFATAATDHKVRVYSWPEAELQLRISCGFGLFNRIDFSPDGALLALPSSWKLQVFDTAGAEVLALSAVTSFDSNELAGAYFIAPRELLVGCDTGRIFRVTF